jgi:hypothetical protein
MLRLPRVSGKTLYGDRMRSYSEGTSKPNGNDHALSSPREQCMKIERCRGSSSSWAIASE